MLLEYQDRWLLCCTTGSQNQLLEKCTVHKKDNRYLEQHLYRNERSQTRTLAANVNRKCYLEKFRKLNALVLLKIQ